MVEKLTTDQLTQADGRMKKSLDALHRELGTIRTGRASPALIEHVIVDYYGVPTPLHQLSSISAADARLLVIQPWDKSLLAPVERAILKSNLGLSPINDGNLIRLPIPPLSQERRQELVKLVRKRLEEGRVGIRNIRRDILEEIRALEKEKKLPQDESKRTQERLQRVTDQFIEQADELSKKKEAELLEL